VKKLIVVGAGAISALAVSAFVGTGVAAADDYAGKSFSDAASAAGDASLTVIVASRVGDKVSQGDCLVERSQMAPFASPDDGSAVTDKVQFYLNCNASYASATTPGPSLASPEGRAAKAAADEAAAKAAEEASAASSEG
jgi:hypothetical protein